MAPFPLKKAGPLRLPGMDTECLFTRAGPLSGPRTLGPRDGVSWTR